MWSWFVEVLTVNEHQWYETFPYVVGLFFFLAGIVWRTVKRETKILAPGPLIYATGEGVSIGVLLIYTPTLIFHESLAQAIAEKNGKIIALAGFFAVIAMLRELIDEWTAP